MDPIMVGGSETTATAPFGGTVAGEVIWSRASVGGIGCGIRSHKACLVVSHGFHHLVANLLE